MKTLSYDYRGHRIERADGFWVVYLSELDCQRRVKFRTEENARLFVDQAAG
jgi:hypothetical protein